MSKLKEKSNFNFDAAQLLIDKNLYAPSVHCSYYGCFQLIKYSIFDFFGVDYSSLSAMIASNPKANSHTFIINYISGKIKSEIGDLEYRNFSSKIKDLKNFRESSDYDDVEISFDKGQKALNYANDIQVFLRKYFNV